MLLGRTSQIIVIIILVIPFSFQGALGETPPVHENFEDAEKDLEILLSLLGDSMVLSEETLYYLVHMEFTPENLSIAMEKAQEFHELLEGAEMLLDQLRGEATSYEYLEEYLTSFQNLDINTTGLIQFYIYLNENRTVAQDYINDTASTNITVETAVQSLNNSESNVEQVKNKVDDIETNTDEIKEKGFSTVTLEELIIETKQLVESDEESIDELSELFTVIPNFLSIYVYKTEFALGDELAAYGYFFGEGDFKSVGNITVFMDDQILDEVSANSTGRYELKKDIPLNHTLGGFEIYASTTYNYTLYGSNRINITVGKIPTKLTLSTQFPVYSPNQRVPFSGRLVDHLDLGLADKNITLYFNDLLGNTLYFNNVTITNISTDIEGYYSFELDTTEIPIGIYGARTEFESDDVYIGSVSGMVDISINIPPKLTLSALETVVHEGENLTFFGQLIDELNNTPLSDMIIEIYIKDEKVGEAVTNDLGRYEYVHSTFEMAIGKYDVHSEFNPDDVRWREAISNIIDVEIRKPDEPAPIDSRSLIDIIYDNLFLIVVLILVLLFPALLYVKKKRTAPSSARQTQRLQKNLLKRSYSGEALTEKLFEETEDIEGRLRLLTETKNLREAIIAGYHILLGILERNKVLRVEPSHTHLDIAKKLTNKGFPVTETRSITKIFEKAMYSNRPIESHTLDDFLAGIRKMFTRARGIKV